MSPHILWEFLKCVVGGETIKYCALKKKKLIQQRLSVEAKLALFESRLINCDPADKNAVLSRESNRLIFPVQVRLGSTAISNFGSVPVKVQIN